jgi:hypothetical protein
MDGSQSGGRRLGGFGGKAKSSRAKTGARRDS